MSARGRSARGRGKRQSPPSGEAEEAQTAGEAEEAHAAGAPPPAEAEDEAPTDPSATASAPGPDEPEDDLLSVLEAILFASHEPMTARRVAHALPGIHTSRVAEALEVLAASLDRRRSPLQLVLLAGGYRLVTRPEYAPYLSRLFHKAEKDRLSPAALETLSIIAYKQPVTRADIEGIRGVQAGPVLRALQERKLIKVVGRAPVIGRPQQYGTSRRFLDHFGLADLGQLPALFGDENLHTGTPAGELSGPDLDVDPDTLDDPLEHFEEEPADTQDSPHAPGAEAEAFQAAEAQEEEPLAEEPQADGPQADGPLEDEETGRSAGPEAVEPPEPHDGEGWAESASR